MTSRFQNKSATDDYLKFKEKDKYPNRKSTFVTKQFEKRQAVITQLLEDNIHIQAVYNIVLSLSLFTMFTLNLKELSDHGRLSPAIDLIFEKFGKLHIVFLIWLANNLLSFFCYYCFILWNTARGKLKKRQFFDKICFILVAIYYAFIFYAIPVLIRYFDIPFASSCIILCEAVRLLMKVHAFIRSNAPKVLSSNTEKETVQLPSVKKFAQFLYLPTSVYRDDYPRSENIRWDFVTHRLFEILWVIISLAHVHIYTVVPIFKTVCLTPITTTKFVVLIFKVAVPSLLILCLLFLACLHSTQEAVGEVIYCGDRMTYSDWWNSLDLQQFYKKWNWINGEIELFRSLNAALASGYRHIDTAGFNNNEHIIGNILYQWISSQLINRKDLFITAKLSPTDMFPGRIKAALKKTLKNLQLEYVDLYLLPMPIPLIKIKNKQYEQCVQYKTASINLTTIWKEMEDQVIAKRTKAIGLSNFSKRQIRTIIKNCRLPPKIVQIEMHPYDQQISFRKFAERHQIRIITYAPLGSPLANDYFLSNGMPPVITHNIMEDPIIRALAIKYNKTCAQIILRYIHQLGITVLPESKNIYRIQENAKIFDFQLGFDDMDLMKSLDKGVDGKVFDLLNLAPDIASHPEYPFKNLLEEDA